MVEPDWERLSEPGLVSRLVPKAELASALLSVWEPDQEPLLVSQLEPDRELRSEPRPEQGLEQ
ncbi:hypothetical protein I5192_00035 [Ruegeria sp. SCSIO 43209]|uniref:hypothetical protein n=1 Tax=Ruegeria sp. SCSIO 43209 TaxID=2793010 RepID=UPI001CA842FF|nr:hypothetical protein [Ruegeria sp. SCSIO 43209]UAB89115.1 hypothetical protein I5192_00035 [Ruegeria sp. SCSIO 43209]